uniref:Pentapeptide repeat-containing protein n=1 Tax=Panagrellus redivivus TaxID=6233 RepID=A0A7E4USC2_PANRE
GFHHAEGLSKEGRFTDAGNDAKDSELDLIGFINRTLLLSNNHVRIGNGTSSEQLERQSNTVFDFGFDGFTNVRPGPKRRRLCLRLWTRASQKVTLS